MLVSGAALATNYLYTTNSATTPGVPGFRIRLSTVTRNIGGTDYSVPCRSDADPVYWNDSY